MNALRKLRRGIGQIELVALPRPVPQSGEVLVAVRCAGICGTDLHIRHDMYSNLQPPVTLGHEFSGVVAEVGADVCSWQTGDRVTVESAAAFCGHCDHCRRGDTQRCPQRQAFGISKDGAFAHYVVARQEALHCLPGHVSFQEAAMTEPLAVAVHAVMERSCLCRGQVALVTGPGTIGQLVVQVARAAGARVVLSGTARDRDRLELARRLGADHIVFSDQQDVCGAVDLITGGNGADAAFECAGITAAVRDCLASVRKGGEVVQVGLTGRNIELCYDSICLKEITLKGSFTHNHQTWAKAVALLAESNVDLGPLISGEFPMEEWQQAFDLCEKGAGLKYLLYPNANSLEG
ncbi:MAG: zinc-binding dehydrogenase [Deltaproteobacteria bacterium]|nr:zinc-binding dehydrogenase [Deltaproteobacteria bacterium]